MIRFNILNGLTRILSGAKFKGNILLQTEEEYNNLEQLDPRPKPSYNDVYLKALEVMRNYIKDEINDKTDYIIEHGMTFNDGTVTQSIHLGIEEQINLDTMDRLREELHLLGVIVFPYKLKVSDNINGEGNYITLHSPDHLHMFFLSGISHKNISIGYGRYLKDTLGLMTKSQLEEFIDPR